MSVFLVLLSAGLGIAEEGDPEGQILRAGAADASSYLQSNWNKYDENYHPNYLLDGDPRTAWVEGAAGDGLGEWVEWRVSRLERADQVTLRIRNGYHKSDGLLTANAAAGKLTVQLWQDDKRVAAKSFEVERRMGWQDLVIPLEHKGFDRVRLQVVESLPGAKYKDLCISDAEVWVVSDLAYDKLVENAKHAALKKWVAGRVEQAAYFAGKPPEYPFASTRFAAEPVKVDSEQVGATYDRHRAMVDELKNRQVLYRLDLKHRVPMPDGFSWKGDRFNELLRWLSDERTLFEAEESWQKVGLNRLGAVRLDGTPDKPLRAVFELRSQENEVGRGFEEKRGWWAVSFDAHGRPVRASLDAAIHLDGGFVDPQPVMLDFEWNEAGRVAAVVIHQKGYGTSGWQSERLVAEG